MEQQTDFAFTEDGEVVQNVGKIGERNGLALMLRYKANN